jgi:DNA-binding transcriptional MocR family regulator
MTAPLYHQLAERVAALIKDGTFSAGAKLPSVRRMSREQRVSVTTVMEAYARLEDQRLVEPRPRSGYYVMPPEVRQGELPRPIKAAKQSVKVNCPDIFAAVMEAVADPKVVPFGAAVPGEAILPSKRLASLTNAVIRRNGASAFSYSLAPGRRELRVALSRRLLAAGVKAGPDEIVITQGATEALVLALRVITRPGDVVAIEVPTYFGILQLVREQGLRVLEVPVDPQEGIDLDVLESLANKHTLKACIVQPSYQNPMGSCMSDVSKQRLAEMAARLDFMVIEDDLYRELGYLRTAPRPLAHFDHNGHVVLCGSVTKSLAPGLRVGWILPGPYLQEVVRIKSVYYPANPTVSELVVAEAFSEGGYERHLRRISACFAEQSSIMRAAVLAAFPPETRVNQPEGGFVLWIEMPAGFDSEEFAVAALTKGISLIPGTIFSPACGLKHCLRLSCGAPWDRRAAKAIITLGQMATAHMADKRDDEGK